MSWERPSEIDVNGVLNAYNIDYFIEGESNLQTATVAGDVLNTTLEGLNNYTIYSVSVYAVTIDRGPPASQVERTSENGRLGQSSFCVCTVKHEHLVFFLVSIYGIPYGLHMSTQCLGSLL